MQTYLFGFDGGNPIGRITVIIVIKQSGTLIRQRIAMKLHYEYIIGQGRQNNLASQQISTCLIKCGKKVPTYKSRYKKPHFVSVFRKR